MGNLGEYDYVIAGAGSAGCALAARLSEHPDNRVLLVEAGGSGKSLFTSMPAGNGFIFGNPNFDWGLYSTPQPGLNGRRIYYPRGRGLGGSSLLNGMLYIRGNQQDFDNWSDSGLPGWSFAEVLPYFKRSESAPHRAGDAWHGISGPLQISPAINYHEIDQRFVAACEAAGSVFNADFNGASQTGTGCFDSVVFHGKRQSSNIAYLSNPPDNLQILTQVRVLSLLLEGNRVTGLQLDTGVVKASREVVLCLGAFHSPQMLMLSGIGPAHHLQQHGIEVKLDLPGVGENLADHPNYPMKCSLSRAELSLARFQRIDRALLTGLKYLLLRKGPGAGSFWSAGLFHAFDHGVLPDVEVYFTPMIVHEEAGGSGWNIQNLLSLGRSVIARGKTVLPGMQLDIVLLRPRSRGRVQLTSNNPLDAPLIDPAYLGSDDDIGDLVKGIRQMRTVMQQYPMADIYSEELTPGIMQQSDDAIAASVRELTTTGHHPVGTCAMGTIDNPLAVLDEQFRVRGIESLRVVDASSFPTQISGNPNAATIMIAEKAADMMLGKPPLPAEYPTADPIGETI